MELQSLMKFRSLSRSSCDENLSILFSNILLLFRHGRSLQQENLAKKFIKGSKNNQNIEISMVVNIDLSLSKSSSFPFLMTLFFLISCYDKALIKKFQVIFRSYNFDEMNEPIKEVIMVIAPKNPPISPSHSRMSVEDLFLVD